MHIRYTVEATLGSKSSTEVQRVTVGSRSYLLKRFQFPRAEENTWFREYLDYTKKVNRRVSGLGRLAVPASRIVAEDGKVVMLLPWVDGLNLKQVLYRAIHLPESFSVSDRWFNAVLLCYEVHRLHRAGVVHSDLKPANVFFSKGKVKLIDFDFSYLQQDFPPWASHEGMYQGTPGYYSREHLEGFRPTHASDVFTLCLILRELLNSEGTFLPELVAKTLELGVSPAKDSRPSALELMKAIAAEIADKRGLIRHLAGFAPLSLLHIGARSKLTRERLSWPRCKSDFERAAPSELRKAIREVRRSASAGLAEAQTLLGSLYLQGSLLPSSSKKAFMWFQRAATQGFPPGQLALGSCYFDGQGASIDGEKAISLWDQAAFAGSRAAARRLLEFYEKVPETKTANQLVDRYRTLVSLNAD